MLLTVLYFASSSTFSSTWATWLDNKQPLEPPLIYAENVTRQTDILIYVSTSAYQQVHFVRRPGCLKK